MLKLWPDSGFNCLMQPANIMVLKEADLHYSRVKMGLQSGE